MKKTFLAAIMVIALLPSVFAGGGQDDGVITLDLLNNSDAETLEIYKQIAENFTKENPGIKINVSSQGRDYEALMKSNMAANSLPDLFMTHGWSVARYSEYMRPLNDQPWADRIVPSMETIVKNDKGEVFVLPIDIEQAGIIVNKDVTMAAGVDHLAINTLDDFYAACEKIKATGKTPLSMWGKDPRSMAHFLDVMANPYYVTSPSHDYRSELANGSFDWSNWDLISEMLVELKEKGYLNIDIQTADGNTVYQEMAKNNVAFIVTGNSAINTIRDYNPELNIGFIPLPAVYDDDIRQFSGGEREAIGVWKDGEHVEEALMFIEYMSRPENIKMICEYRGNAPGVTGVEVDLGILTEDYQRYQNEGTPIYPFFDRVQLPSGMWSVLQDVGAGLIAETYSPTDASKVMEDNYLRLRSN